MLSEQQRAIRRNGIGSSEIAKVCGIDFWGHGPHRVWLVKRGLVAEQEPTIDTQIGDAFEAVLGLLYTRQTGVTLERCADANGNPTTLVHPTEPWILASVDWLRADSIPVECKWTAGLRAHYYEHAIGLINTCATCGRGASMHWGREPDSVPDDVRAQCAWQMAVTGASWMHVARLWITSFERDFCIYTVMRNARLEANLIARGRDFWHNHVLTGTPPEPDASDDADLLARTIHPRVRRGMQPAPPDAERWVEQYRTGHSMVEQGKRLKAEAANWLRRIIGDAEGIEGPWGKATAKERVDGVRQLRVT